mmetsp:Transcript_35125/g.58179  ORF Transcript_35125/g.58179 Transcript_35125/m.58179 type:complete len:159 (+) Transcript_35125:783-1259(+)
MQAAVHGFDALMLVRKDADVMKLLNEDILRDIWSIMMGNVKPRQWMRAFHSTAVALVLTKHGLLDEHASSSMWECLRSGQVQWSIEVLDNEGSKRLFSEEECEDPCKLLPIILPLQPTLKVQSPIVRIQLRLPAQDSQRQIKDPAAHLLQLLLHNSKN